MWGEGKKGVNCIMDVQKQSPPHTLSSCRQCPRLADFQREQVIKHPGFHCAPVAAWGSKAARLLVVGLAPGLQGAARTGKGFVGDASSEFLFACLHRYGFADNRQSEVARLQGARITNIVKCLPPNNRPLGVERRNCEGFLRQDLADFKPSRRSKTRVILCLGKDAFDSVRRLTDTSSTRFVHGQQLRLAPNYHLLSSFHPSRLNVNTGRLTPTMFDKVFQDVCELLNG